MSRAARVSPPVSWGWHPQTSKYSADGLGAIARTEARAAAEKLGFPRPKVSEVFWMLQLSGSPLHSVHLLVQFLGPDGVFRSTSVLL